MILSGRSEEYYAIRMSRLHNIDEQLYWGDVLKPFKNIALFFL